MIKTITKEEFISYPYKERKSYMLGRTQLQEFWIIGRIAISSGEAKTFFFIKELVNPYTGNVLESKIFTDSSREPLAIHCRIINSDNMYYANGTLVATKVKLNHDTKHILDNKLFNTTFNDVYPIEETDEVFKLLNISKENLNIIALAKPFLYEDKDSKFVNIANDIIKVKIKDEIETLHIERENNKKELLTIQREYELLEEKKYHIDSIQKKFENLGFALEDKVELQQENLNEAFLEMPDSTTELLKAIQTQLGLRGYYYEEKTLRQLLLSLMTEQMIILSGPSGTGKTTLVNQIASIINAECEIIPVQPSWTDKQDLLGFYNPIRKLYVPSGFLDCLIEAKKHEDRMYIICLDEMNLAQIEYYLADILSVRELEGGKVRLYSDFEHEQNMNEIKWFIQKMTEEENISIDEALKKIDMDSLSHYEMITRFENLKRYPSLLEIPRNVRIIGTMNQDGVVQPLSPKVIDRSFIIPLYRQEREKIDNILEIGCYDINSSYFEISKTETTRISNQLSSAVDEIKEKLKKLNIEYNDRTEKQILLYYIASKQMNVSTKQLVDDIVLMKFLPRIHEIIDDEQLILSLTEVIESHVKDELSSLIKLEKMKQKFKQTELYSYWS